MYARNLPLSTTLSWSHAAVDRLPRAVTVTRNGQALRVDVSGTTKIVLRFSFISLGETTMHGLTLRNSEPLTGSGSNQYNEDCLGMAVMSFEPLFVRRAIPR